MRGPEYIGKAVYLAHEKKSMNNKICDDISVMCVKWNNILQNKQTKRTKQQHNFIFLSKNQQERKKVWILDGHLRGGFGVRTLSSICVSLLNKCSASPWVCTSIWIGFNNRNMAEKTSTLIHFNLFEYLKKQVNSQSIHQLVYNQ